MLLFCLQVWLRLSFFLLRPQTTAAYFGETPNFIPSGCLRQVWTTNLSLKDNLTQPHRASFQSSWSGSLYIQYMSDITSNILGGVIGPVGFGGSLVQKESKKDTHTSIWFELCLMKQKLLTEGDSGCSQCKQNPHLILHWLEKIQRQSLVDIKYFDEEY